PPRCPLYPYTPLFLSYLGFPVAALAGLAFLSPQDSGLAAPRRVLDALLVGSAFGLLAWVTVLESVIGTSDGSLHTATVSVASPVDRKSTRLNSSHVKI